MAEPLNVHADRDECLSNMKGELGRLLVLMKVAFASPNHPKAHGLASEVVEQSFRFMANHGGMVRVLMDEEIDRRNVDK